MNSVNENTFFVLKYSVHIYHIAKKNIIEFKCVKIIFFFSFNSNKAKYSGFVRKKNFTTSKRSDRCVGHYESIRAGSLKLEKFVCF